MYRNPARAEDLGMSTRNTATAIMEQAKQVPDEMLLALIDAATDPLELAILTEELDARTCQPPTLASLLAEMPSTSD